jgi:hypothetical protein
LVVVWDMYRSGTVLSWRGKLIKLDNCIWWTMGEVLWVRTQVTVLWLAAFAVTTDTQVLTKICHSWSRFWHMMSKMLCVSSCSTISLCIQSITSDCLQCHLHHAVREKHPDVVENVFIVHDSDTAHAVDIVRDVWWHWVWEILKTPHFSPELDPYDHDLNHKLKQLLRGKLFTNREDILVAMWCKIALFKMSGDGVLPFSFFSLNHGHLQGLF